MEWIFTIDQLEQTATRLWNLVGDNKVLAFHGEMGSGKTTFIHALCSVKNVKDTVGSPTFSIINEYVYPDKGEWKKIYHIDLYRLKDEEEARQAGIEDCLYNNAICLVEWPEKAAGLLPDATVHLYLYPVDEQTRRLQIGNN